MMKELITILLLFVYITLSGQMVPRDKQLHFYAGTEIGFAASALAIEKKPLLSFGIAVGSAAFIGIAKELYDIKHGSPEVKDAAWTVIGGVAGYLIVQGFKFIGNNLEALIRKKTLPRLTWQK